MIKTYALFWADTAATQATKNIHTPRCILYV